MDVRINEVQSRVQAADSHALLDPQVMREIVRQCLRALKEEQEQEKYMAQERKLASGISSESH
ncbi:MAG: hypothetical protein C5B50_17430 [Verrucomicrobia bacterium]|nr:MAG: hypothetical protein C5B50_17430 [Verrucomicrobiota bacterium]